ncbi:dTDP-4-dehydrorhamnose 3,5-epimerase family protein [Nocardioides stalactiti]|uniref:dTDP-4-dehydrorhamnose 3,5-epimerase family protein n=1 Tax=Nocardioides stalactiti TaxID=2755356 RepID=UPI001601BEF2|nr:dTDP-4-dehydrorhamnose 3,5-epimerase family protein [Nocardioides stalactiti]
MRFEPLAIAGAFVVHLDEHRDERGSFARTWCADEFAAAGIDLVPVQCNLSRNTTAGTLRGMHFQRPPHAEGKLIQCVRGSLFDAFVDLRRDSPTFGTAGWVDLDADEGRLLYLPPGLAHGFVTTADRTDLWYGMGARYVDGAAAGLRWDDPDVAVPWPVSPTTLSERDAALPLLSELPEELLS